MSEKVVEISEDSLLWIDERYNRLREENKRLNSIIKEVREYIKDKSFIDWTLGITTELGELKLRQKQLLEILEGEQ